MENLPQSHNKSQESQKRRVYRELSNAKNNYRKVNNYGDPFENGKLICIELCKKITFDSCNLITSTIRYYRAIKDYLTFCLDEETIELSSGALKYLQEIINQCQMCLNKDIKPLQSPEQIDPIAWVFSDWFKKKHPEVIEWARGNLTYEPEKKKKEVLL